MSDPYVPESAMVIVAHPDDIEWSCAGTLALWAQAGTRLVYVLCTSGEAGIDDPAVTREEAIELREREQRTAAEVVGAAAVIFLHEPDGLLQPTLELRKKLVCEIRRHRPEVVICGDPTLIWMGPSFLNHPDHRAAATAAMDAVWPAAGQRNLYPDLDQQGLALHRPRKLYVTGWIQADADLQVVIEETIGIKATALRAHQSQMGGADPEPLLRRQAAQHTEGGDLAYAESFRVITLLSDERWESTRGRTG